MSEPLKAKFYEDSTGLRLFLNDTEFPWPISDAGSWGDDEKYVELIIPVDEVRWVD